MKFKRIAAIGAVIGVALTGFGMTAAQANPIGSGDGYVIVGSDTLQDAVNALTNGTKITGSNVRSAAAGRVLSSFDAFPNDTALAGSLIQTKAYGPYFQRPAGSGNGKKALLASMGVDGTGQASSNIWAGVNVAGQIDLSRSSGGPTASGSGSLAYIPFGRDAVSFAFKAGSNVSQATISTVSTYNASQLLALYQAANGDVTINASDHIIATLPQSGSGTREFFLKAIGHSSDGKGAVSTVPTNRQSFAENTGSVLAPAANEIWVIPFSVASYVAQVNGAAPANTTSGITLGSPQGAATPPFTGSAANLVPGANFYASSTWGRDTYIVAPYAKVTSGAGFDAKLFDALDYTNDTSLAAFKIDGDLTPAGAVKQKFGFLEPTTYNFTRSS
ncbi:MAG: hypothetical protein J0I43_11000 [Microbacterium sp.]|uniref:hypothetical protein n=1 Tax=Microbacterium sp. TaxID=51671 RepID=UPI001AD297CC|nr:hypothetical protein [Microbacterium sp.]MBN9177882.1 hypothetical protein [Microbacterium sp.]